MRIVVVGAGIVGVSTADELAADGPEVIVLERRGSVAAETSFANAGVIAPGYVAPWAAPGMPAKVVTQWFGRHAAVRLAGPSALRELPWMWRWWRACSRRAWSVNRPAMQRLAQYSRDRLRGLTAGLRLEYEQQSGYLVLLRGRRELRQAQAALALLREQGVAHELVDAQQVRRLEPWLHAATPVEAAIHLPQDGVGNCRQFAHLLKGEAQRSGARFRFDTVARRIVPGARPVVELGDGDRVEADAVVVCAGVDAAALLSPLGLRLPLAPVFGYSITAPLRQTDGDGAGPRSAVMDERYKVAITRLGQRVRVAGAAELGGSVDRMRTAPLATLYKVLDDWFPGAVRTREAQAWKGARPMLPDGPPVLGASGLPGVWLNVGHGSSGWALACGSARVLADRIAGRPAEIDLTALEVSRLR
ncbi:MAG: D-amino acid dehydrogenase [Pseudomonadota bacterium]